VPTPTGISTDPPLTAHGVRQSRELALELTRLDPPAVDLVYCSPYYRCLQTLLPTAERVRAERGDGAWQIKPEPGLGFVSLPRGAVHFP
jgi:transcription factor C subunit 7